MTTATGALVTVLIGAFLTASVMTLLQLPGWALPMVLVIVLGTIGWALGRQGLTRREAPPERHELALLGFAALVGMLRLGPYAYQYMAGVLVGPVTWDDNWHFQEVASLVHAEHFPPRLNYAPDAFFHFYYVPWVPAAAISSLLELLTGAPMIKLGLALGALLLDVGIAWALIVIVRHFCPVPGRVWALAALLVAGAAIDGVFVLRNLVVLGGLQHAEWWQVGLLVTNSFSALSSALIWVPHHLIAAMAMLLAVVVATQPQTLEPRRESAPYVVAGLLIGTALYSSIFAFAGGLIVLSPLLWELVRANERRRLGWLVGSALLPALPLAYIYLGAEARGGFVVGQAFFEWWKATGNPAFGINGVIIAFVLMVLEVGWLYVIGRGLDRGGRDGARLRALAVAGAVMLASTAVIGFSGSNNWALRATIVPVVLLACYVGCGFAEPTEIVVGRKQPKLDPMTLGKAGAVALGLAAIAHVNETSLLVGSALRAPGYGASPGACSAQVARLNALAARPPQVFDGASCDGLAAYHIEKPFLKGQLTPIDRELMGRGFGFLGAADKALQQTEAR